MSDQAEQLERLTSALADRYRLERELAAALGAERFVRVIEITANLNHSHMYGAPLCCHAFGHRTS